MARVYTFDERNILIDEISSVLDSMNSLNKDIKNYRDQLIDTTMEGNAPDSVIIETDIITILAELDQLRDRTVSMLNSLTFTYDNEMRPTAYRTCTAIAVTVDNGSSKGVLQANSADNWFDVFDAGDTLVITNSENSNDGEYVVDTVDLDTLTFTTVLAGTNNADDEAITITLKDR